MRTLNIVLILALVAGHEHAWATTTTTAPHASAEKEAEAAETWGLWGVAVPGAAGVVFATLTAPGGEEEGPPGWQIGALAGLFGSALAWGPSVGYYRGGLPLYATLAGIGKTAVLVGGVFLDTRPTAREGTGLPIFSVMALGGVVGWDLVDFLLMRKRVRARHSPSSSVVMTPLVMATSEHTFLGAIGRF